MKLTKESIFLIFNFLFLLLPFIAFQWKYDGYEYPKYIFLILFGSIFGLIFLGLKKFKSPNFSISIFLSSFILSMIFSTDFLYSYLGDYPRLNFNFVILFSILIISIVFKSSNLKINIFSLIFFQSLFLNLITFFEINDRVFATFGQPNFLGIVFVLGIIYSIENSNKNKLFPIATLFLLIGLVKTGSITSIICLIIYVIYLIFSSWGKNWKTFLQVFLGIFFLTLFIPTTKEKLIDNINLLFNHRDTKVTDSILVRFSIWEDSLNILFYNPKNFLIGIGPETFSLHYEKVRSERINQTSEWDSLIDKPHNFFLETLLEQGILGLVSLSILLIYYFKSNSPNKVYTSIILIFLFFNWAHIFLQLIFFIEIFSNLFEEKEIKNIKYFKIINILFILTNIVLLRFYYYEEIDHNKYFFQSNNPQIKVEGIRYYSDINELKNYLQHLKKDYKNNLKIWFEIYSVEKKYNLSEKENTKNRIKEMRPDLVEWHEIFR